MIDLVRRIIPRKPVGILSNGTLINKTPFRMALHKLDMVTLKLDPATQEIFQHVNHPANYIPPITNLIKHYKDFRKKYGGFFGLEVMALDYKGTSTIKGKAGKKLIDTIVDISPDVVQIEVTYRPPAKQLVSKPKVSDLAKFTLKLNQHLGKDQVWVYGERDVMKSSRIWKIDKIEDRITSILTHRPCTLHDLSLVFGKNEKEIESEMSHLLNNEQIRTKQHDEKLYYLIK